MHWTVVSQARHTGWAVARPMWQTGHHWWWWRSACGGMCGHLAYLFDWSSLLLAKTKAFSGTLSGLRDNVRTASMARSTACCRHYICHNGAYFAISYGWDVMSGNLSNSKPHFLNGVGVNIWQGRGHRPSASVGVRKLEWLPLRVVPKCPQCII